MTDLSRFDITRKWPAAHPERLQLYSLPTPNGVKVSILLEELGLPHEPHPVSFDRNDQLRRSSSLNLNNKIPPSSTPTARAGSRWHSSSRARSCSTCREERPLPGHRPAARYEAIQWLMFQMGGVGPMFGQGFLPQVRRARTGKTSARAIATWNRIARLLKGAERAARRPRVGCMGSDYSIADIATWPG